MTIHTWEDYKFDLYDSDWVAVELNPLEDAIGLRWIKALYGQGEFSFSVPLGSPTAEALQKQELHFFRIWRAGLNLMDGFIMKPAWKGLKAGSTVDVHCEPLAHIAKWRCGYPETIGTSLTKEDFVDNVFNWMVDHTLGASAPTVPGGSTRVVPDLTTAADVDAYPVEEKLQFHSHPGQGYFLYKWLQEWGVHFKVDWDIAFNDDMEPVFTPYYPRRGTKRAETDYTDYPIIFNDAATNLSAWKFFWDASEHYNAVISANLSEEVEDATAVASWMRREVIAGSSNDLEVAKRLSLGEVAEGYDLELIESIDCQYRDGGANVRFDVGDLVTVNNIEEDYGPFDWTIAAIEGQIQRDGQEKLKITFGDPEPDIMDKGGGGGALPPALNFFVGLRDDDDVIAMVAIDGTVPVLGDGHGISTTKVDTTVNGATVDAIQIEGPWYRDVTGTAFLRQKTMGDELRIKEAGAADLFYVDAAGNVGGYTGGGFLQMLFRFYSMGDYAGGSVGIHNINMAGDLTSDMAAGGSHLRWANAGDQGHFHQILTTNAPLGGVTGWVVDEEGHSYWKPAALLTLEGTTYRPPLAPPANVNQVMGVSTAAGTIQMVWKDSPVSLPGTLTAATGNVAGLNHTHAITTTTVSAASTIVATDASGYIRATRLESGNAGNYLTDTGTAFMISADGLGIQLASAGVNQVSVQNGFMFPAVTDDIDLGTAALRWKSVNSLAGDFSTTVTIGAAVLDEVAGDLEVSVDFLPSADNSDTLGTAAKKWSTIYGVEGNLTGDLTVNTAGKGLIMSNNGDKTVMFGNGVRCTMKSTLFTGYTDTFTAGGFRAWLKVYETESTGATVVGYLDGYEHYHNLAGGAATAALGYS